MHALGDFVVAPNHGAVLSENKIMSAARIFNSRIKMSIEEYKALRAYIDDENKILNYRMTWLITINGFLFAAYAIILQKIIEMSYKTASMRETIMAHVFGRNTQSYGDGAIFLITICLLGVLFCKGNERGIINARKAVNFIENFVENRYVNDQYVAFFPGERMPTIYFEILNFIKGLLNWICASIFERFSKFDTSDSQNPPRNQIIHCIDVKDVGPLPFITGGGFHKPNQPVKLTSFSFTRILIYAWIILSCLSVYVLIEA